MDSKHGFRLARVLAVCGGVIVLTVVAMLASRYRSDAEVSLGHTDLVLSAADMTRAFQQDPASAEERFQDRVIELNGVISHVEAGRAGTEILVNGDGSDVVKCTFSEELSSLKPGAQVRVKGKYSGRSTLSQALLLHLDTSINGCLTNCLLLEPGKH